MESVRTIPIGCTLLNPHGVPIRIIETRKKSVRLHLLPDIAGTAYLHVDLGAMVAEIRLTNAAPAA